MTLKPTTRKLLPIKSRLSYKFQKGACMLRLCDVASAWNALEWDFSFKIGDGVSLIIASVTAVIALLTYRIQKEQKNIVEQQNKIIERQVAIDEARFSRDNSKLKLKLGKSIDMISTAFILDEVPKGEWFKEINDNMAVLKHHFGDDVCSYVADLLFYRPIQVLSIQNKEPKASREEAIKQIQSAYSKVHDRLLAE